MAKKQDEKEKKSKKDGNTSKKETKKDRKKDTEKETKRFFKKLKRGFKKHPILTTVTLVLVLAIGGTFALHTTGFINIPLLLQGDKEDLSSDSEDLSSDTEDSSGGTPDIVTESLSIHFLKTGNKYTGDCTLIKTGNTEILIDAGSRQNSAKTIKNYVDEYCTDGVLEYVIATHADQDHIAGFVGLSSSGGNDGILYEYDVTTLIQFPLTGKEPFTEKGNKTLYGKYLDAVEYAKGNGTAVYTALECWNGENGAARSYTLGEGITINFLYQKYYETATNDENDYSVCMLLTQGTQNFLFTGDLEHKGEASLVEHNDLPECVLYKGGHHGSPTSSTDALLSVIKPQIVCVCCCCGSTEYTDNMANVFPAQAFVDRVAPYTDRVYVTTMVADNADGFASMNGNIVVSSDGKDVTVRCSNNDILLKDTDWFKENRTMPEAWKD